jgi:hypothetical protein
MMRHPRHAQCGTFAVEFTVILLVLLTMLFGIIEMARLMYVYNALQDVTRRAAYQAAGASYQDASAMRQIRQHAIFRNDAGELLLGAPVTDDHVRIDYLALVRAADNSMSLAPVAPEALAAPPATNRIICTARPNDPGCIRFVRARICAPGAGADCGRVNFRPLFGLFPSTMPLPVSTTIVPAASLGYVPGDVPGPMAAAR